MASVESVQKVRPVVVGVDGSRTGPAAVDLAVGEAVRRGAPLRIVHVWPGRYTGVFRGRGALPSPADARRLLDVSARRARLTGPDLEISTELLDGGAAPLLTSCSEQAQLLVVGHRDEAPFRSSWGSTAAYLAHHSACPLLVHRGPVPRDGPVVVASSARSAGSATLGYALGEAALLGARLVAVHMWTRPSAAEGSAPAVVAGGYATERQAAEQALAQALAGWSGTIPKVAVERLVVNDLDLAYTIERASRRGRLLVAGIGRHGRFAELLYGSFNPGPRAAHPATCPVALVPPDWPVSEQVPPLGGPVGAESR
jgi:nucleotide-binding universal stress UspA family protein